MSQGPIPTVEGVTDAARYAPYLSGTYDVRAGLARLGTDYGNGAADAQAFQFDAAWVAFRQNKLEARADDLAKYCRVSPAFDEVAGAVCGFLARHLAAEHPRDFERTVGDDEVELRCHRTGETLRLDAGGRLLSAAPQPAPSPPYAHAFDALACQVAEDIAVVRRLDGGGDEVCAIHLCAANHWAAAGKIGHSFAAVHRPVPGIEQTVNPAAARIVDAMIERGPFVRFVWGLATDTRLNHHPVPPPGIDPADWHGRRFDPQRPRLFVRVERQVTWGLPEVGAALFLIRNSFRDGAALRADPEANAALQSALESMDAEQAAYKGVEASREVLLAWLRAAPEKTV